MNRGGVRPKHIDEYEGNGPRPPVPGQESNMSKMTESAFERNQHRKTLASYSKWNTLTGLLEDAEGLKLFKKYVESEAKLTLKLVDSARLNFYIICEGLKLYQDEDQARCCILAIYKQYIHKGRIQISISNTDSNFKQKFNAIKTNEHAPDIHIFDLLQQEAFRLLNETAFQNFLQSDDYISHISNVSGSQAACTYTSSSSGSGVNEQLARSAVLPTVVEDQELLIQGDDHPHTGDGQPIRLTKELLLSTQRRRLEARPPATHGYSVYNTCASFNPVSRQDSERQSCSSGGGGKSDSETMSVTSSRDGRSHVQRRQNSIECNAMLHINKDTLEGFDVIPRTQRLPVQVVGKPSPYQFEKDLMEKLEKLYRERELIHQLNKADPSDNSSRPPPIPSKNQSNFHGQLVADLKRFQLEEDNDQSILDQHVSRVWSDLTPHRSPGTISPCPAVPNRRRTHDPITAGGDAQSMRHSKSMPDHASSSKRLTHKWSSMNTDSGISLFSTETLRSRDLNSRSRSMGIDSVISTVEEASRRLEDESRRSRRHSQHPPQSHQTVAPFESTVAVYTYLDEDLPYRSRLPGLQPTLRQFKEYLPKKGNFRFFFKTACEDPDSPIIQEEIVNDDEVLPLFEGKVMGLVKPCE